MAALSDLQGRGVAFRSLTEAIDTESAAGRLLGHMLAALAEFERSLIVERAQTGLKAARQKPASRRTRRRGRGSCATASSGGNRPQGGSG